MAKTVQPRQPTREGQALKREDERIRERADAVILDGRLTNFEKVVALKGADIKHGLGRTPNGYFLRVKSASAMDAPVREVSVDAHFVKLFNDSSVDVEVQLWVF